jgi:hypothetical protein
VPQEGGLFDFLTVKESYEFFHGLHTIQKDNRNIDFSNLLCFGSNLFNRLHCFFCCVRSNEGSDLRQSRYDYLPIEDKSDGVTSDSDKTMVNANSNQQHPEPNALPSKEGSFPATSPESIMPLKYQNYLVRALSGGNKKKLSVAISNINDPSFLAIDECTSGNFL